MKKYNAQQEGGFPFETDTLTFQQNAYDIFNVFGEIVGDKSIIKGCETQGQNTSPGYIYVNGELFEFKGGVTQDNIILVIDEASLVFEDGVENPVFFDRHYTFGVGTNSILWSEFKKFYRNEPIHKEIKMVGAAVIQSDLPDNWFLADGNNDTDDLRDMFIKSKGAATNVGLVGGSPNRTLTAANMPKHRHQVKVKDGVMGDSNDDNPGGGGEGGRRTMDSSTDNGAYTEYTGADNPSAFNIEPPHYIAVAIQYIKPN